MKNRFGILQHAALAADPEAFLLSRLVTLVLSWPCRHCGKTGICQCYQGPHPAPINTTTVKGPDYD